MLVSTPAGSTPQASASSRACSWSSASRSRWWSRAWIPAAARTPTWRIPPPSRLRQTRASAIASAVPTTSDPIGAPRPLLRQTARTSATSPYAVSGVPVATWAFHSRAPSRCTPTPRRSAYSRSDAEVVDADDRSPAEVVGVLHRDRAGRHEERPHVGGEHRARSCRGRAAGPTQVRIVRPVTAACTPSSARAMWAEASQSTSCPTPTSERTASTLASEPVAVNSAASLPSRPATFSSSARTVGSSP